VWRRVLWRPVRHLADWHVNTQIGSRRNALIASTAFAERSDHVGLSAALVERHGRALVFCRTRRGADRVAKQLKATGLSAVAIHGNRTQGQRERALAAFSAGRADALVATDVAARGIHVDHVACVVHFDLPADPKDYVHRSGRTGRAGATGTVVSLVTAEQRRAARTLQRALGMPESLDAPTVVTGRPAAAPDAGRSQTTSKPRPRSSSASASDGWSAGSTSRSVGTTSRSGRPTGRPAESNAQARTGRKPRSGGLGAKPTGAKAKAGQSSRTPQGGSRQPQHGGRRRANGHRRSVAGGTRTRRSA
jgi:superfamily II DNA/RNA helicase